MNRERVESHVPQPGELYDVIVAGGGPAGIGAAVASARSGARTLLLEARPFLGGVGQVALWMPWNRVMKDGGSRGGAHELFVATVKELGADAWTEGSRHTFLLDDCINIHPDYLRLAVFLLLERSGCRYQLYSPVCGVEVDDGCVRGVTVSTKQGPVAYRARVVVDATGDGDVARLAGVPMVKGREDGSMMALTLVFALAGTEYDRIDRFHKENREEFDRIIGAARDEGYVTFQWYSFDRGSIPGVVSVNNGGIHGLDNLDGTNEDDLTLAQRQGIQGAVDFVSIARSRRIPGLESCSLLRTGAHIAVRESWRIVGEHVFDGEEAKEGKEFPDTVARKYGGIDDVGRGMYRMKSGCAFPYRSLVPLKIDNLLVAGRCSSATHSGFTAGRGMGNMMGLGQAAGTAAALCVAENVAPRRLAPELVRRRLQEWGVQL